MIVKSLRLLPMVDTTIFVFLCPFACSTLIFLLPTTPAFPRWKTEAKKDYAEVASFRVFVFLARRLFDFSFCFFFSFYFAWRLFAAKKTKWPKAATIWNTFSKNDRPAKLRQRRINVIATPRRCIDVDATLYKRHLPAGYRAIMLICFSSFFQWFYLNFNTMYLDKQAAVLAELSRSCDFRFLDLYM